MRWILVLLLILPASASARVAVVVPGETTATGDAPALRWIRPYQTDQMLRLFDELGVDYKIIPCAVARTEFCRTGRFTRNFGTPGATVDTFEAVIHLWWHGRLPATNLLCAGYGTDSLTLTVRPSGAAGGPLVPQLFLMSNTMLDAGLSAPWRDATNCTTGVTSAQPFIAAASGVQVVVGWYQVGYPERVIAHSFTGGMVRSSTSPAGGFRPLIALATPTPAGLTDPRGVNPIQADSLTVAAAPDTLHLWERPMAHLTAAQGNKSLVFCYPYGASNCYDSIGTNKQPCEGELPIIVAALARLDSASGGEVFNPDRIPRKFGLAIQGGFSRSGRRNPGGIFDPDSATLKAVIDSLSALGVPAVLGVNVDSIASYPNEVSWWNRWPSLKVTPWQRAGLDSAVAGNGNASWNNPRDVWGRFRNRLAYQGSDCHAAGDTSIRCLLLAARYKMEASALGSGRTSSLLMPPDDDWSPKNTQSNPRMADSALYAAALSGGAAVLVNTQTLAVRSRTNPVGYVRDQRKYNALGQPINLMAHSGYWRMGSHNFQDVRSDSSPPAATNTGYALGNHATIELQRSWGGLLDTYSDYDFAPYDMLAVGADAAWHNVNRSLEDMIVRYRHSSIVLKSVQDFGGNPNGPPPRGGWWHIKSLTHSMRIINRLAGRTIVTWDYPENIEP